jgi:hypothetical protein
MAAEGMGERIALGAREGGITFGELAARAQRVATAFTRRAVERVVVIDLNSNAVPISPFGATLAGKPFVPVNFEQDAASVHVVDTSGAAAAEGDGGQAIDPGYRVEERSASAGRLVAGVDVTLPRQQKTAELRSGGVHVGGRDEHDHQQHHIGAFALVAETRTCLVAQPSGTTRGQTRDGRRNDHLRCWSPRSWRRT